MSQVTLEAQAIYLMRLRQMVDPKNGLVGYGKRILTWKLLATVSADLDTRKKVRRHLDCLEKVGLIAPAKPDRPSNSLFLKLPLFDRKGPAKGPVGSPQVAGVFGEDCPQMAAYSKFPEFQKGQQKGQKAKTVSIEGPAKGPVESPIPRGLESDSAGNEGQQKGHIINHSVDILNKSSIKMLVASQANHQLTDDEVFLLDSMVKVLLGDGRMVWDPENPKQQLTLFELVIRQGMSRDEAVEVMRRASNNQPNWRIQYAAKVFSSLRIEYPNQPSVVTAHTESERVDNSQLLELRNLKQELSGLADLGEEVEPQRQKLKAMIQSIESNLALQSGAA